MKLYLATGNLHKIDEVSAILAASGITAEVFPPSAVGGMPDVIEDGDTFEANARFCIASQASMHLKFQQICRLPVQLRYPIQSGVEGFR
jgi:inosine/xanthosine triphosphate pyrophosphatase family protein